MFQYPPAFPGSHEAYINNMMRGSRAGLLSIEELISKIKSAENGEVDFSEQNLASLSAEGWCRLVCALQSVQVKKLNLSQNNLDTIGSDNASFAEFCKLLRIGLIELNLSGNNIHRWQDDSKKQFLEGFKESHTLISGLSHCVDLYSKYKPKTEQAHDVGIYSEIEAINNQKQPPATSEVTLATLSAQYGIMSERQASPPDSGASSSTTAAPAHTGPSPIG